MTHINKLGQRCVDAQGPHGKGPYAATVVVQHVAACFMASLLVVKSVTTRCYSQVPLARPRGAP